MSQITHVTPFDDVLEIRGAQQRELLDSLHRPLFDVWDYYEHVYRAVAKPDLRSPEERLLDTSLPIRPLQNEFWLTVYQAATAKISNPDLALNGRNVRERDIFVRVLPMIEQMRQFSAHPLEFRHMLSEFAKYALEQMMQSLPATWTIGLAVKGSELEPVIRAAAKALEEKNK